MHPNSCIPFFSTTKSILFHVLDHNILEARPKFMFNSFIVIQELTSLITAPRHNGNKNYKQKSPLN